MPPGGALIEPCSYGFNAVCYASGIRLNQSITDGLSNTIGVTEHYGVCRKTVFEMHIQGGSATIVNGEVKYVTSTNPPMRRTTFADHPMYDDVYPVTKSRNGMPVTAGSRPLTFQVRPAVADCNYRIPQSSLPGGLSVGYLDGSVRILNPNIAAEVFWAEVTPAGGEQVAVE